MHQEFFTIEALYQYTMQTPGHRGKGVYILGRISDELVGRIAAATGLQVAGYRLTIDHSAIIHALRQHGQPVEVLRGQLPITEADVLGLATWLPDPTHLADAGQVKGQPRCLKFELATSTARFIAIMEVRTGRNRQQLALKTCYKKRPAA